MNRNRLIINYLQKGRNPENTFAPKCKERATITLLFSALLTIILHSCTPQFITPPVYKSDPGSRHSAIENYLRNSYSKKGTYTPMAYGEIQRIRPSSHEKLYELMQEQVEKPNDRNLERKVEKQRELALSDTSSTLFREDHHFLIEGKRECTVVYAYVTTDQDYRIRKVEEYNKEYIADTLVEAYTAYFFEKSLTNPRFKATTDELVIYRHLKNVEEEFPDSVSVILNLVQDAQKRRASSFDTWIHSRLKDELKSDSLRFENLVRGDDEGENNLQIVVHDKYLKDGLSYTKSYWIGLDPFLNIRWKKNF